MDFSYFGPFKVLGRYDKCFELQLDRKIDTVSLDRLKSVCIPTNFQRVKETFIDFNQTIENNPHKNYEDNDNAIPENQQQIQGTTETEEKTDICMQLVLHKKQFFSNTVFFLNTVLK